MRTAGGQIGINRTVRINCLFKFLKNVIAWEHLRWHAGWTISKILTNDKKNYAKLRLTLVRFILKMDEIEQKGKSARVNFYFLYTTLIDTFSTGPYKLKSMYVNQYRVSTDCQKPCVF